MPDYQPMSEQESLAKAQAAIRRIITARDDRNSLVTQIAVEVGAEIVEGVVAPGHDLNSVELANRYRTSRTPIREALMLLEKEGLVDIPPRRRPRVMVLDIDTIREIYRTRAALLEFVAADVATLATDEELALVAEQVKQMEAAYNGNDVRAYLWANIAFQDLNLTCSKNMTAKRIVEALLLRTIPLRRMSLSRSGRLEASLDDHRRLVKAYMDRDANLASALTRSNHITALKNIERLMSARDADRSSQMTGS